jgi:hypothetical protein
MTVLGVFFTRGVSLRQWVDSGLFDREVLIYHVHLDSEFFLRFTGLRTAMMTKVRQRSCMPLASSQGKLKLPSVRDGFVLQVVQAARSIPYFSQPSSAIRYRNAMSSRRTRWMDLYRH